MSQDIVLVTGGTGFLAKHIVVGLISGCFSVRATVRSGAKAQELTETVAAADGDVSRLQIIEADLTRDHGWRNAATGCRFVLHTASPFPVLQPKSREALVPVARGGAIRVMEAARAAGVERVVMTSSIAAMSYGHRPPLDRPVTESDFSNVDGPGISPYAVSKTLAEVGAREALAGSATQFVSINPVVILGPALDSHCAASLELIRLMMRGRMPFVPRISVGIVDVRDVAAAHVAAMTAPGADGRRFILAAGSFSLGEIASVVGTEYPDLRKRLPRVTLPDVLVKGAAIFSRQLRHVVPELGGRRDYDTGPTRQVLGISARPGEEAISATACSLRSFGLG
ncbi:NAD-dependent epimerase/dehydratase family protein [Consotaella salsifontis]|uniref:Dihydroflavonol-4-reductase n=1 Tax=Consotaella salsifontis TaxID=1365950 RepID=A0A1T4R5X0_9HYPH|nr:NAD-dependent epimerase/dehydratase family protein [Consotaella salsifontis]SKA11297.1 dihydroflavonol-4-reductase [Consotaella salsifontis]